MYKGIAGSEGIGIGKVVIIEEHEINIENKKVTDTDNEIKRLQDAIEKFVEITNQMAEKMDVTVGKKDADILRGHIQMLQDPMIEEQISTLLVAEKITAEMAVDQVLEQTAEMFAQIPDELLQQRATDFRDIKTRMIKILLGIEEVDISQVPANTVLVARDLTPSMTAGINPDNIAGILTEVGGRTSHSAILARAMEIPAVLSIEGICSIVKNGDVVAIDGTSGEAIVNPDEDTVKEYEQKLADYKKEKAFHYDYHKENFEWLDCHQEERCIYAIGRKTADHMIVGIFNFSDKEQKDYKLTIKGHHTRRTLLHTEWEQYGGTMKKRKENIHLKKKGKDSEITITLPRYSGVLLKLTKKE